MSKYLGVFNDPMPRSDRLAKQFAINDARTFFAALERELLELAAALLTLGYNIAVIQSKEATSLRIGDNGPTLRIAQEDGCLKRTWLGADSVVPRADAIAPIPIPSKRQDYAQEAEAVVLALASTVQVLLR